MSLGLLISEQIVFNGVVLGMVYALLALGVVLIFRASGVINFAQGPFGAFGASVLAVLYVNEGIPFYLTIPLAIISGALFGGLTELFVVRRLFKQPRLLLFIATIGVAQIVLLLQLQLPEVDQPVSFPTPITGLLEHRLVDGARRPADRAHRRADRRDHPRPSCSSARPSGSRSARPPTTRTRRRSRVSA